MLKFTHIFVLFCFICTSIQNTQITRKSIKIINTNIIDVINNKILSNATISIKNNIITNIEISPPNHQNFNKKVIIINGANRYLIPGLIDSHIHMSFANYSQIGGLVSIAKGVTYSREGGDRFPEVRIAQRKFKSGEWIGPEMIICGRKIESTPRMSNDMQAISFNNPERAYQHVLNKNPKVDQIKVHSSLRKPVFRSVIRAAKRAQRYVTGHIPNTISFVESAELGQKSNEHLCQVGAAIAELAGIRVNYSLSERPFLRFVEMINYWKYYPHVPRSKLERFSRAFSSFNQIQIPTLNMILGNTLDKEPEYKDSRKLFITDSMLESWKRSLGDGILKDAWKMSLPYMRDFTKILHENGVKILSGIDNNNPWTYIGYSLYDEMIELQNLGVSSIDALRSATIETARFFKREKSIGSIEIGKEASLVLLMKNPLENIANVDSVDGVLYKQKYYNKEERMKLLKRARSLVVIENEKNRLVK